MSTSQSAERLSVGLDVGGTKILGVLVDGRTRVLNSVQLPTVKGCDGVVGDRGRGG